MSRKHKNKKSNLYEKANKSYRRHTNVIRGLIALNGLALIGGGVGVHKLYEMFNSTISECIEQGQESVKNVSERNFNIKNPTVIYDRKNKIIKEFKSSRYKYAKLKDINKYVSKSFISIEDERFYEHGALDFTGLFRASVRSFVSSGDDLQGGSTLTQQLSKNVFLSMDRTFTRKIKEIVIAKELEKKFSKDEILEFYLNNIYFANGCYGIESASEYYFSKPSKELTLSESAFLSGIPNNPNKYNPIHNYKNTIKRRNIILDKMRTIGNISDEEYQKAINQKIKLKVTKEKTIDDNLPFATSYAINKSVDELLKSEGFVFRYSFKDDDDRTDYYKKYNKVYEIAEAKLKNGGYKIKTCIDSDMQHNLQHIVDESMSDYTAKSSDGIYKKQASVVTIDNKTGQVVAIVGGRTGSTYNRAYLSPRQSGSIIKPIIAYAPAFERGYVPSSMYNDSAITNGPNNWYKGYKGYVPLREGLTQSINTIAVKLVAENGVQNSLDHLRDMQFRYILPSDKSPIIGIGGFTKGVTNVEMASAFSTISRNGEFIEPTNVTELKDNLGKTIYKDTFEKTRVYDSGASYLTTSCLQSVINEKGATGYKVRMRNWSDNQAGKTGTTDGAKDAWFAGYTPYYTTIVWVGDDIPSVQPGMAGAGLPGKIWRSWMEKLHDGLKDKPFSKPKSVYESGGELYDTAYNLKNIMQERKDMEQERIELENKEQTKRLKEVEYRTVYHLTDEEENRREQDFADKLKKSQDDLYKLTTVASAKDDYKIVNDDKNELKDLLNKIKRNSAIIKANAQLESYSDSIQEKYSLVLEDEERIRKEEEAKRQAEEEAKRQAEEEAKRQAEEELRLEEERKKQEEAIKQAQEEAQRQQEKAENQVNTNQDSKPQQNNTNSNLALNKNQINNNTSYNNKLTNKNSVLNNNSKDNLTVSTNTSSTTSSHTTNTNSYRR